MYENLNPRQMDCIINRQGKRVRTYFIGFCSLFLVSFIFTLLTHPFFSSLTAFIFIGFLLIYYMQTYIFIRILRLMQFDGNFFNDVMDGLKTGVVDLDDPKHNK